jgi:hypothetical protein
VKGILATGRARHLLPLRQIHSVWVETGGSTVRLGRLDEVAIGHQLIGLRIF